MKVKKFDFQKIQVTNDDEAESQNHDEDYIVEEEERVSKSNQMVERNKMKKAITKLKNKNIIRCDYEPEMDDVYHDEDNHNTDNDADGQNVLLEEELEYLEEDPCDDLYEEINNIDNYNRVYIKDLL